MVKSFKYILIMTSRLPEGKHKFSGIEPFQYEDKYGSHDGYYIIIDNVVYAFEIDHDDGYRSYGDIYIPEKISVYDIKNRFFAQDVVITQHRIEHADGNKHFYSIIDIVNGKTILEIGTDYTDYYPMVICHYYPENMSVNQQSTNVTDNSDNNYTNNWAITSTGVSGDYQLDENVIYICN